MGASAKTSEYLRLESRSGRVCVATKLAHGVGSMPGNYKEFRLQHFFTALLLANSRFVRELGLTGVGHYPHY